MSSLKIITLYFCNIILATAFGLLSSHKQKLKRITGSLASSKSARRVLICFPGFKPECPLFLTFASYMRSWGVGRAEKQGPEILSGHKTPDSSWDFKGKKKGWILCNHINFPKSRDLNSFPQKMTQHSPY